ncbi:MAG: hypothetical protein QF410_14735 [Planctomycetota bacterium]|nr:hypothetical protein [Planctomycetota bacterium]
MAKRPDSKPATETLEEIEGLFDRLADWVSGNPRIVLGVLGGVLGLAAAIGLTQTVLTRGEERASRAISELETEFRRAMGAQPGDLELPELANPEAGKATRLEYIDKFLAAAEEHDGSRAAVAAWLQAGELQEGVGDLEGALATWRSAAEGAPAGSEVRGLALLRHGAGLERSGDFAAAAAAYGEAGAIEGFPARHIALAHVARCWVEAGDEAKALAAYATLEAAEPAAGAIPAHVEARLEELRARHSAPEAFEAEAAEPTAAEPEAGETAAASEAS